MSLARRPLAERFWPKVDRWDPDACWLWTAGKDGHGYGRISSGGSRGSHLGAHRVAYEFLVGPIPTGLSLDHLCRVPACVNPKHLEPVTHRVNCLRGTSLPAQNARKTQCDRGHPFDDANTSISRGWRRCLTCHREDERRRKPSRGIKPRWTPEESAIVLAAGTTNAAIGALLGRSAMSVAQHRSRLLRRVIAPTTGGYI